MPITNGTIKYVRRVNDGDFQHREVSHEVTYTVPDGESSSEWAGIARDLAVDGVHRALGTGSVKVIETEVEDKKPRQTRSRKPAEAADPMGGPAQPTADAMGGAPVETPSTPAASADPMGSSSGASVIEPPRTATAVADAMGPTSSAPVVTGPATDASPQETAGIAVTDMTKGIVAAMTTLTGVYGNEVAGAKISELIREFGTEVTKIPVDKRGEFLARLKVLA